MGEETMEVPLISLTRIMPELDKVMEHKRELETIQSEQFSVLGAVIHFRRELYMRLQNAKQISDDEETAPEKPSAGEVAQKSNRVRTFNYKGATLDDFGLTPRDIISEGIASRECTTENFLLGAIDSLPGSKTS